MEWEKEEKKYKNSLAINQLSNQRARRKSEEFQQKKTAKNWAKVTLIIIKNTLYFFLCYSMLAVMLFLLTYIPSARILRAIIALSCLIPHFTLNIFFFIFADLPISHNSTSSGHEIYKFNRFFKNFFLIRIKLDQLTCFHWLMSNYGTIFTKWKSKRSLVLFSFLQQRILQWKE